MSREEPSLKQISWQLRVASLSIVSLLLTSTTRIRADIKLAPVFSDHAVFQRDKPIRIWGTAKPGEEIEATFGSESLTTEADETGAFQVTFAPREAGGPFTLVMTGANRIELNDILIGEVWFCSGQSNMTWPVVKVNHEREEIDNANFPEMRLFTVPEQWSKSTDNKAAVSWLECSPRTVSYFSATAYFFGRKLHEELDVPIGLIVSAVPGTRIEPWTARAGVEQVAELVGVDEPIDGELFQSMVRPCVGYAIRGFIWYQGEGNVGDSSTLYYHRMRALILGWRKLWGDEQLPFFYVQIAPLNWGGKPVDVHPEVWEAQLAAMRIPNTGMAITVDIGNIGDAHPRNKQDVGDRLARWALAKTYGKAGIDFSGPLFTHSQPEGQTIRVHFRYCDKLETSDGEPPNWFEVAGKDGQFYRADARIDGRTVIAKAVEVPEPQHVRMGWHQIAEPNLTDENGLPASPFRSDGPFSFASQN